MGIFFVSKMNQRQDPRLRNPPFFVKSCQFYRTLRQFSEKVAFRSAGSRISCCAQKRRCRNRVFPIGGWTEMCQNVCFCYIRANGSKKKQNLNDWRFEKQKKQKTSRNDRKWVVETSGWSWKGQQTLWYNRFLTIPGLKIAIFEGFKAYFVFSFFKRFFDPMPLSK